MAHMAPCGRVAVWPVTVAVASCSCGSTPDISRHLTTQLAMPRRVRSKLRLWNILKEKFMIFHGMQSRADIDFMWFHDILCHIDPFWERFIRSVGTCWDPLEVSCSSFIRFLRRVAFCRHRCLFSAAGLAICCYRLGIFWNLFWM
jgi:hypothetical protein